MKILRGLLKAVGIIALVLLGMSGWMAWDGYQLRRDMEQVIQALAVGGSPFAISLPQDRLSLVSVRKAPGVEECGSVQARKGVVRSASVSGKPILIRFDHGIDLRPYAASLSECAIMRITLLANASYLKASVAVEYADAKITGIGSPVFSD
jgi:hypothetical protein